MHILHLNFGKNHHVFKLAPKWRKSGAQNSHLVTLDVSLGKDYFQTGQAGPSIELMYVRLEPWLWHWASERRAPVTPDSLATEKTRDRCNRRV